MWQQDVEGSGVPGKVREVGMRQEELLDEKGPGIARPPLGDGESADVLSEEFTANVAHNPEHKLGGQLGERPGVKGRSKSDEARRSGLGLLSSSWKLCLDFWMHKVHRCLERWARATFPVTILGSIAWEP
jgi:hypothetical protein